jgi:hypothetical protein
MDVSNEWGRALKWIQQRIKRNLPEDEKVAAEDASYIPFEEGDALQDWSIRLFKALGYTIEEQVETELGVSYLLEKEYIRCAVRVVQSQTLVGLQEIQAIVAARKLVWANSTLVITNCEFTPLAVRLAQGNEVVLWDRKVLRKQTEILQSPPAEGEADWLKEELRDLHQLLSDDELKSREVELQRRLTHLQQQALAPQKRKAGEADE